MDQHPSQFNTKIDWAPAIMFGMVFLFFAALGIFSSKSNSDTDQKILQAIEKGSNPLDAACAMGRRDACEILRQQKEGTQ